MFEKVNEVTPATVMLSAWLLSSSWCVLGKNSILLLGTEASGQVKEADSFIGLFFFSNCSLFLVCDETYVSWMLTMHSTTEIFFEHYNYYFN